MAEATRPAKIASDSATTSARAMRHGAWLREHRVGAAADQARFAAVESRWSWLRLLFFFGALIVWVPLGGYPWAAAGTMVVGLALFLLAVRRHQAARVEREFADRLLLVIDESLARCGGHVVLIRGEAPAAAPQRFELASALDDGETWELTDQERDDLDVFARPVGLFGLLNRASTRLGERRLRDRINRCMLSAERIVERQKSVAWLCDHPAERLRLLAAAAGLRKEDKRLEGFVAAVEGAASLALPFPARLLVIWSYVTLGIVAATVVLIVMGQYALGWALGPVLSLNALLYFRMAGALQAALGPWRDVAWGARGYLALARQAARDLPADASELQALRARFAAVADRPVLPAICARLGWTESGGLVGLLVNTLAFSDMQVARALLGRVVPNRAALAAGAAALADLEALLSLACFAYEQPQVCWPTPRTDVGLSISGGRHPLVPPERIVPNDVALDARRRIWIVTGSNMAGKSTLLRMIGTNVLLAQIGSAVAAERFEWRPLRLITDLRARDNLAASESYFLSEVRHLRRMVLPPTGDAPLLGLIDEPFRGTNSHDQTAASRAVVLHLLKTGNLFLVATHDRWLTELADGETICNFHFRENLSETGGVRGAASQANAGGSQANAAGTGEAARMVFDYHLHAGPATTRNALLVLEREGYPPELLKEARAWEGNGAVAEGAAERASSAPPRAGERE